MKILEPLKKNLSRELAYFFCIGLFTTSIDFIVYSIGHYYISYSIAKTISFITGSCFSYLLHKHFTFQQKQHKPKNILRFATLYILSMGLNVLINSAFIIILTDSGLNQEHILISAFLIATAFSTIMNFIGQKFWVFNSQKYSQPLYTHRT